jgi:hypothetical protein
MFWAFSRPSSGALDCSGSLWFYLRILLTVVLCSWSGLPARPRTQHDCYRVTIFWYVVRSRVPPTLSRYDVTIRGNVTSVSPPLQSALCNYSVDFVVPRKAVFMLTQHMYRRECMHNTALNTCVSLCVFACSLEAAAPTVFMGLATVLVLTVTFRLHYIPFSPNFAYFPKFISCVLFMHFIIYMYYNLWLYSSHVDTVTPSPVLLCPDNSTQ